MAYNAKKPVQNNPELPNYNPHPSTPGRGEPVETNQFHPEPHRPGHPIASTEGLDDVEEEVKTPKKEEPKKEEKK